MDKEQLEVLNRIASELEELTKVLHSILPELQMANRDRR